MLKALANEHAVAIQAAVSGFPELGITITDADDRVLLDPNHTILVLLRTGDAPTFGADLQPDERWPSLISGAPGVLYESESLKVQLTPEELFRLLNRSLTPDEFRVLLKAHPSAFELHGDYYCSDTGRSVDPVVAEEVNDARP